MYLKGRSVRWVAGKFRNRSAISARVRGGEVHLCSVVAFDSVSPPHVRGVLLAYFKDVPFAGKAVDGGLADARLDENVAAELLRDGETSRLKRRLDVHAVVDNVGYELRMREGLVHATHDAEADVTITLLHEGRDNGVEWALMSVKSVR